MGPQVSDEKISLWWSSWCMKQLSQTLHAGGLTCNIIHYDIFLQLYGISCKTCWIYSTIIFSVSFILKLWKYLETTLLNTPVKDFIVNWVQPPSIYVYIQISPLYQHVNYQLIGHPHQNLHRIFTTIICIWVTYMYRVKSHASMVKLFEPKILEALFNNDGILQIPWIRPSDGWFARHSNFGSDKNLSK